MSEPTNDQPTEELTPETISLENFARFVTEWNENGMEEKITIIYRGADYVSFVVDDAPQFSRKLTDRRLRAIRFDATERRKLGYLDNTQSDLDHIFDYVDGFADSTYIED